MEYNEKDEMQMVDKSSPWNSPKNTLGLQGKDEMELISEMKSLDVSENNSIVQKENLGEWLDHQVHETKENGENDEKKMVGKSSPENSPKNTLDLEGKGEMDLISETKSLDVSEKIPIIQKGIEGEWLDHQVNKTMENEEKDEKKMTGKSSPENSPKNTLDLEGKDELELITEMKSLDVSENIPIVQKENEGEWLDQQANKTMENGEKDEKQMVDKSSPENSVKNTIDIQEKDVGGLSEMKSLDISAIITNIRHKNEGECLKDSSETTETTEVLDDEKEVDPVFDGTEASELEKTRTPSSPSFEPDTEASAYAWPEKAAALKNFVKVKGAVAVSTVLRRLSGSKGDNDLSDVVEKNVNEEVDSNMESQDSQPRDTSLNAGERSTWNPLNFIKIGRENTDAQNKPEQVDDVNVENSVGEPAIKGRIILFTRLGCAECKEVRSVLHQKRLKFIEINIDIYPNRKLELEKNTGSSMVPRVYFNDFTVAGISELKALNESEKFDEILRGLINEEPSPSAPLPPLSGEDDVSGSGKIDDLAIIVSKLKESIILRDRFYKMRKFRNCFLGSEAVDFLAEDQYLEREEAVEFGRKLANKHFFGHVLDENAFEDGNHLYRFLEHDPIVMTQCYNIPRGTIDVIPKPITEIASRLRFLSFGIFEAYVSENGRHVDYKSIQGSEEFQRYLRTIEELQRVELDDLSREEKLAFFINLYNMMAIHAILMWGYPVGALDRRKFLGDFKYVIGGCTYSLSVIQNGILRGNQRPPYNLMKPFGPRDKRFKVSLPYPEPLVHFALVCGTRSGPALRCYSPGNVDKELMEAARNFMRNEGLVVDLEAKVASVNKILRWYSVDLGKNEMEVLKHAANYLEPVKCEELLELLANTQLKVIYQPYDWGLNS